MKNIKFRAWQKYHKKMVEVTSISFGNNGEINRVSTFVENQAPQHVAYKDGLGDFFLTDESGMVLELMQYTGLKDKHGVEIYEGDILKCTSEIYTNLGATGTGEYEETIKQVIWKDDSWGIRVISSNLTSKGAEKSGLVISAKYAEVIGNIYENPELLEESE